MGEFQGGKEYLMRAHFGLPSVEAEDKEGKPPISVKFEIPYFTTSGIQVRNNSTNESLLCQSVMEEKVESKYSKVSLFPCHAGGVTLIFGKCMSSSLKEALLLKE